MSQHSDRYRRLSSGFAERIRAVPADRWERPSPCEGWTARDVVRHVAETPNLFFGLVGRELGPIPPVEDDPLATFLASSSVVQRALDDPEVADAEFDGVFGRTTFAEAVDRFVGFDLNVHGWDLARATGTDERIDPDELPRLWSDTEVFGPALRSSGVCGAELEPPAGADEQTRLLAFLGRA